MVCASIALILLLCSGSMVPASAADARIGAVTDFELWDVELDEMIVLLQNGTTIPMREGGFNIRAIVNQRIGSLSFGHNGVVAYIENSSPYFFCADDQGVPNRCTELVEGEHIIEATPHALEFAEGPTGASNSVYFIIVPNGTEPVATTIPTTPVGETEILSNATEVETNTTIASTPVDEAEILSNTTTQEAPETNSTNPLQMTTGNITTDGDFEVLRINCGGLSYTDSEGNIWSADTYFVNVSDGGAYVVVQDIIGTTDDALFQSERWGMFQYEIPVPTGEYQVVLHFAEIFYNTTGSRIFGLVVEDQVLPEFDIVLLAGANFTPIKKEIFVSVSDGFLSIAATKYIEHPKISAMEVRWTGPNLSPANASQPTGPVVVNVPAVQVVNPTSPIPLPEPTVEAPTVPSPAVLDSSQTDAGMVADLVTIPDVDPSSAVQRHFLHLVTVSLAAIGTITL